MTDPRERQAKMAGSQLAALGGVPVMVLATIAFVAYAEGYGIVAGVAALLAFAAWIKMIQYAGKVGERTAKQVKEMRRNE